MSQTECFEPFSMKSYKGAVWRDWNQRCHCQSGLTCDWVVRFFFAETEKNGSDSMKLRFFLSKEPFAPCLCKFQPTEMQAEFCLQPSGYYRISVLALGENLWYIRNWILKKMAHNFFLNKFSRDFIRILFLCLILILIKFW